MHAVEEAVFEMRLLMRFLELEKKNYNPRLRSNNVFLIDKDFGLAIRGYFQPQFKLCV